MKSGRRCWYDKFFHHQFPRWSPPPSLPIDRQRSKFCSLENDKKKVFDELCFDCIPTIDLSSLVSLVLIPFQPTDRRESLLVIIPRRHNWPNNFSVARIVPRQHHNLSPVYPFPHRELNLLWVYVTPKGVFIASSSEYRLMMRGRSL